MEDQVRCVTVFSTLPAMLDSADGLLSVAATHTEQERTLAACASLVLAATLEQATWSVLSAAVITLADNAGLRDLQQASVRRRVVQLPNLLTFGEYELDTQASPVRHLHDLITLRNDLMHVLEEPDCRVLTVPAGQVDLDVPLPAEVSSTRWFSVRLQQARLYRAAVDLYAQEVLFPPAGCIVQGQLVRRARPTRRST